MGARKFVVFEIGALGCNPSYVNKIKPTNSKCVDYLNEIIILHNKKLQVKLKQLQCKLAGSTFVVAKYFNFTLNLVQTPEIFGESTFFPPCTYFFFPIKLINGITDSRTSNKIKMIQRRLA